MSNSSPAERAYWTGKQKVIRGKKNHIGVPIITMVESAYDEIFEQVARAVELEKQIKCYRKSMKKAMKAIQENLKRWNYKDEILLYEAYIDLQKTLEENDKEV